jgi:hypothetical protein
MNKFYAIWDTETKQFVNVHEVLKAGADVEFQPYPELFSDDDSSLAILIHEAGMVGIWEVVPINLTITLTKQ